MAAIDDLKAAGFSDEEIGAYVKDKSQALAGAGFSTKEVSDYLGVAPAIQPAGKPRVAKNMGEAWDAGYQRSLAGLIDRSAPPEIVIDAHENPWYQRWAANLSTVVNEAPEGIAGAIGGAKLGGAAGSPLGPVGAGVGAAIGGGAGAMYLPAVIREAYAKSVREGSITSKADWLSRIGIALKNAGTAEVQMQAAKEGAVGMALGGVGKAAGPLIGKVTSSTAAKIGGTVAAEVATAAIAPAAIEGRLPETHEWIDAATIVAGFKGVTAAPAVAGKMLRTWEKTGRTPTEQLGDMARDPTIREDLVKGTAAEAALREEVKKQGAEPWSIDQVAETQPPGRISTDAAWGAKDVDRTVSPSSTDLAALRADIQKNGVREPITITVSTADGRAYITDGNNRLAAARELGLPDLPYKVELTDVPFTPEQRAKSRTVQELGLTEADLQPGAKSAEALAAEDWLRRFNAGEDPLPRAYEKAAAEAASAEAFPGDKAKTVIDSPMADLPQAKLSHQLNLRYIEAPADVQALLTRMSEVYRGEIDAQRGGTKTWEQTGAEARQQLQGLLGDDAKRILAGREGGDAINTVEIKIRSDLLMQATLDTSAKLEVLKKAGADATPTQRAQALESVHKLAMIQAELTGAAAEAGRALQQMKAVKNLRDQGADIARLYELYGKDPDTMLKMLGDMQTPEQLSQLVKRATDGTPWQKFIEYYRASLMSGFLTVGYNIAGNTAFLAQRNFLVEPGAALVGLISRSPDRVTFTEVGARWYGSLIMAPVSMVRAGAAAFKNDGIRGPALAAWEAGQERSPGPVLNTGVVGKFTKTVYGTNSMLDAMFRTLTEQGEVYSLATKEAIKQGHEPGTIDFFREVKAMVENPTDAMLEAANKAGERAVFAAPMGDLGRKFSAFADASKIGRFVVPFQQTPTNILKETFRNSPFAPLVEGWRADVGKGGAARDKAVAEMAVGTALWTSAVLLASQGKLTGYGDPDPRKRAVQMQSGWQPYSYKTSDGQYIPLVRLAPTIGTMLGMAADVTQMGEYMTPEDQYKFGKMGMLTFKNAVTNQTMLSGITNVLKAMDDENSLDKWVNSTAGSLVPASGMLGQIAALKDPYQREVFGTLDAIRMKIPGVREQNQPRIDAWGEVTPELERPLFIAPVKVSKQSEDKVRNEAARLGVGSAKAPKQLDVGINQGRLGMVELTPEQRTAYAQTAGELSYRIVEPVVNSAGWDRLPDIVQRQIMQDALEDGRKLATATAFEPDQLQAEIRARGEELRKRLQPK